MVWVLAKDLGGNNIITRICEFPHQRLVRGRGRGKVITVLTIFHWGKKVRYGICPTGLIKLIKGRKEQSRKV